MMSSRVRLLAALLGLAVLAALAQGKSCEEHPEEPVCGSDGMTYPNLQALTLSNDTALTLHYCGPCLHFPRVKPLPFLHTVVGRSRRSASARNVAKLAIQYASCFLDGASCGLDCGEDAPCVEGCYRQSVDCTCALKPALGAASLDSGRSRRDAAALARGTSCIEDCSEVLKSCGLNCKRTGGTEACALNCLQTSADCHCGCRSVMPTAAASSSNELLQL